MNTSNNLSPLSIPFSKAKGLALLTGCLVLVGMGMALAASTQIGSVGIFKFTNVALVVAIGLVGVVFFGLCAVVAIIKLLDHTPGLTLSCEGLTDNASGVSAGFVPWTEITAIQEYKIQGQKFVSILVENPEKYVNRGNALKRLANRANLKLSGTPINITANTLKISHQNLLAIIEKYFCHYT